MENKYTINSAPSLTWNWLKSNCDTINLEAELLSENPTYSKLPEGIEISTEIKTELNFTGSGLLNIPNAKFGDKTKHAQNARITTAAKESNEVISNIIDETVEKPLILNITKKVTEPLILNTSLDKNNVSVQIIHGLENSEGTVILVYNGNPDIQLVQTKVYCEENAKLHIIKVQLLGDKSNQYDDTQIVCGDNSNVLFTQIELGGNHIDSGLHTTLSGYKSSFKSNVAYLCKNNQYLDMNHIVYHLGKKTECDMQVNGTLKDQSSKVYRGTIDFKNGCSGSKGNEMEETLLLSPTVVNKSLPVILCDEEDVEGEHGATIGRLSSDILFYMESRGISQKEIEEIMSVAKVQAVVDKIPDDKLQEKIINFLNK